MFIKKLTSQVICNMDEPIVSTPKGKLRGLIVDGTYIFRGIKYCDAQRFMMPTPVEKWDGVKEAIIYGSVCPEMSTPVPHDEYTVPHVFYPQHEDCQYLNVWTQSTDPAAKRPVLVWLHGGGFSSGSGIEHYAYDGENMSRFGNAVIVTLNHRLNVLGHLDLSDYGEEFKYSGNAGIADLVAALEWVRENIASFGGDPDNVTIFGQSGGGGKVVTLLQTPSADGLYHRAVVQSGVMSSSREGESDARANAKMMGKYLVEELGLTRETIHTIQDIPYWQLAPAAERAGERLAADTGTGARWSPVPDGDFYMGSPFAVGFRKETVHIPLMVGSVYAEFSNNFNLTIGEGSKNWWSEDVKMGHIREKFGDKADEIVAAFKQAYPGQNIANVLYLDCMVRKASVAFAKLRAAQGCENTYNFLFCLESPFNSGTLPWHNAEIPYVFHNAEYLEPSFIPGITETLQDIVCGAWINFAGKGDPNHAGMAQWPRVTADHCPTMLFDRVTEAKTDYDEALIDIMPAQRFSMPRRAGKKRPILDGPRQHE